MTETESDRRKRMHLEGLAEIEAIRKGYEAVSTLPDVAAMRRAVEYVRQLVESRHGRDEPVQAAR